MGSPRGATCSTLICSPGRQPISMSFKKRSLLSNEYTLTVLPGFISDNRFMLTNVALCFPITLRILEMSNRTLRNKVSFHEFEKAPWLKNRRLLKQFIPSIFRSEKTELEELLIIFCSDEYLLRINQEYLHHDDYTDIITFDLSDNTAQIRGQIYISLERITDNSSLYGIKPSQELQRVLFHGALHLCGFKDKTAPEKELMRAKEDYYLKKYHQYVSRETRST